MAGTITVVSNGQTVRISDRTYSLTDTISPVHADAYKQLGVSDDVFELWRCQPSVRTVVGFLARNIAQVALHGFAYDEVDDGRRRLPRSSELARTLRKPDRAATAYEWAHALVTDVCLADRYCAQIFLEPDGRYQIVRIPPKLWKFVRSNTGRPTSIEAKRADGSTYTISLDRALWLDGFPIAESTSPIEALRGLIDEQAQSATYRRDLWHNGGRFPGVLKRPADAPKWAVRDESGTSPRDRFREAWGNYAAGGTRAGGTPILEDGMEYEAVEAMTPEDAQQLETRKFTIAEVAAAYYVHPQLLGLLDGTYSNVSAYREILYSDTLGPWFEQIEQAMNCRAVPIISPDPDSEFVEFNVQAKLRTSFESQAAILQSAVGAPFMLRSEARARLNLPPLEGADELVVPLNVLEGGQASPTDSGSQNRT